MSRTKGEGVMDNKVMFKLTYGLFVLTAKEGDFQNGCIVNTPVQVTSTPNRISIAVNKANKTCEMIDATGEFNISILTESTPFEIFKHFGFQSGKNVNKFEGWGFKETAENGIFYLSKFTNAYISCKVFEKIDLGTHLLFLRRKKRKRAGSATCAAMFTKGRSFPRISYARSASTEQAIFRPFDLK